jgi:hypothetical protein
MWTTSGAAIMEQNRRGRRHIQNKKAVACLALWYLFNNIALTAASGPSRALWGINEVDSNGRKGVQRVRRKLRHRGLQSKPRSASGAQQTIQHGNIFLSRADSDGKSIPVTSDFEPVLENDVPRRVVNPFELGVKGQGYLLRGHDDEAGDWGSSRNSNADKARGVKGGTLGTGRNESSSQPRKQPKRDPGVGVAWRKGAKEAGVGTKDKSRTHPQGADTVEGPGLNDMAGVNTFGDAWEESTTYYPELNDIIPISTTGGVTETRDGNQRGIGGGPSGPTSKGKAPGPRTHNNGPMDSSTQLEGRQGQQNISKSEGLNGTSEGLNGMNTSYPVQMTQPNNTEIARVTAVPSDTYQQPTLSPFPQDQGQNHTYAPVVLNSAPIAPSTSVPCPTSGCTPSPPTLAQPSPQETVSPATKYSVKGGKEKSKTLKGLKNASKNEEELQGRTSASKEKSLKSTKTTKALPIVTLPGNETPSVASTSFGSYEQAELPNGFAKSKGGNSTFMQPNKIEKKDKSKDDKARKRMPGDGKMKGVMMKSPRGTLPPAEYPLGEELEEFVARSAIYQKPRPKAIYPPKKEPASDELIKLSGKLKKSGDKDSAKDAPKEGAMR